MKRVSAKRLRRGVVLLEVLLSLGFFMIAAVSFTIALRKVGDVAEASTAETTITRILDSALIEALSTPQIEVGRNVVDLDEFGTEGRLQVTTAIEELELETEDGQILPEMYEIVVTATWLEGLEEKERAARTWRYGRAYRR